MSAPALEDLKKVPIFSRFTPEELETVRQATRRLEVREGDILFSEGDAGDSICFVVDGRLDVMQTPLSGEPVIVNALSRGQSFGEMAIMEKKPRSATIKAVAPSRLITLDRSRFETLMQEQPTVAVKILMGVSLLLSKKLRQTNSRLINYMTFRPEPLEGS